MLSGRLWLFCGLDTGLNGNPAGLLVGSCHGLNEAIYENAFFEVNQVGFFALQAFDDFAHLDNFQVNKAEAVALRWDEPVIGRVLGTSQNGRVALSCRITLGLIDVQIVHARS